LFMRDPDTGRIATPDGNFDVVKSKDGGVELAPATEGKHTPWKLQEDFTLVTKSSGSTDAPGPSGDKEYLQFPGIRDAFTDSRLLEPVGASSNVLNRPDNPANYAFDGDPGHAWMGHHGGPEDGDPPTLVMDLGGSKHVESARLDFAGEKPPSEFSVHGSTDGGHTWRTLFATDLNKDGAPQIPLRSPGLTHLRVSLLSPGEMGLKHVHLFGKHGAGPYAGGYPIFGPVGRFSFEHLRGPLPDLHSVAELRELSQRLEVLNSRLSVAEEKYLSAQSAMTAAASGGGAGTTASAASQQIASEKRLAAAFGGEVKQAGLGWESLALAFLAPVLVDRRALKSTTGSGHGGDRSNKDEDSTEAGTEFEEEGEEYFEKKEETKFNRRCSNVLVRLINSAAGCGLASRQKHKHQKGRGGPSSIIEHVSTFL